MYAILIGENKALIALGRKTVSMARHILKHQRMNDNQDNRRWILANLAEVTNINNNLVDFGYYQNVSIEDVI